jgi:hypothetical protein
VETENAVRTTVAAFKNAWKATISDYSKKKINSERCLQAALYFHLRKRLSSAYVIYIEPAVRIGSGEKLFIDTLICRENTVLLAAELKYKPKHYPSKKNVASDLQKLMRFRNRRSKEDQVKVELRRYLAAEDDETIALSIAPNRRIVFASYCRDGVGSMNADSFWVAHRPWLKRGRKKVTPPRLLVCLAKACNDGTAKPEFFGRGDMDPLG